jgi:alpha-mannosidase
MHANTRSRIHRLLTEDAATEVATLVARLDCQISFAKAFPAALEGKRDTGSWVQAVEAAERLANEFDPAQGVAKLKETVRKCEEVMAPIGEEAKSYRIHCVGHGHIDMNWMWSWPETVSVTHDTFASILALMEEYPEFTYSQSQTAVYALIERYHPDLFERIKQRVREGRWEVAAVHWVEGDKNLASGTSLVRQMQLSRRYFKEKFGLDPQDMPVDWEPDTFGHANTIPTILRAGSVKYYYCCRPGGGYEHHRVGDERPALFWWEGPDGSRLLVNRETTWYNSYVNIGDNIALPMASFVAETGLHEWLNVYGIGNHGGGPTRRELDYYLSMREWPIYPQIVFSTAKRYFEAVELEIQEASVDLPVIDHELNFEFTGCYTSQSLVKQANRKGENLMLQAETLATLAHVSAGQPYPEKLIEEGWVNVLFNQFHDILPGSGVRETREHAMGLFQETAAIAGAITRNATKALTADIDTLGLLPQGPEAERERQAVEQGKASFSFEAGAGIGARMTGFSTGSGGGRRFKPFAVFNTLAWDRSEPVTVTVWDSPLDASRLVAIDEIGRAHPTLLIGSGREWGHDYVKILFHAEVPSMGYRTYIICEGTPDEGAGYARHLPGQRFITQQLELKMDRFRSGLESVVRGGREFAGATLGCWKYVVERPRGMTAWALGGEVEPPDELLSDSFSVIGSAHNEGSGMPLGGSPFYVVQQTLRVPAADSSVKLRYLINPNLPRVDVEAEVDWREIGSAQKGIPGLVVEFPVSWTPEGARYETPFGSVMRHLQNGEEVPTLQYAHVPSEKGGGLTLLQDSKYGHSLSNNSLRMRVVRSSFDPDHAPEVARHTFRYSMVFENDSPTPTALAQAGLEFNNRLIVAPLNLQPGSTPSGRSYFRVKGNIYSPSLYMDQGSVVLEAAEMEGIGGEVQVIQPLPGAEAARFTSSFVEEVTEQADRRPSGEAQAIEPFACGVLQMDLLDRD